ncbi:BTAD domain-containing putative transcriptional regulator [Streptomyces phaeofaciens JCM 4814]|uniref:SARP family transcriptional regulator n=1 Tax=Streptomyces phaeofaciens TaxID=68254 RepID=A0A918M0P7_9ACTN|nr:BTAD domain-containing putative transcriptional regulator [Streptomyces phaeofaciens]GGT93247.1 SARP family transcriptional regulator [Streptomyces phaeofaciens]
MNASPSRTLDELPKDEAPLSGAAAPDSREGPHGGPDVLRDYTCNNVQFSVLGPVRVWRDGIELSLGPKQQRLILAALLARPGRSVSLEELVELLWDGSPPASAANAVHRHVGTLRRLLQPELSARVPGRWLVRQGGGYLLRVSASSLDLLAFRSLMEQARAMTRADRQAEAVGLFTTALGLWQGRAGADLDLVADTYPGFVVLEHEYVSAVREAAEVGLNANRAAAVLPFLRQAAERNPLDEAVQAQLMMVLAADGKQAEAMASYEALRLRLADELGVDPGAELRTAYHHILHQQVTAAPLSQPTDASGPPVLEGTSAVPGVRIASAAPLRPAQLPADLMGFTGRREILQRAKNVAQETTGAALRILAIDGIPGIGKTAVAVHLAHQIAAQFPDGQLYADLRGFAPEGNPADPHEVLHDFLDALGVAQQQIPVSLDRRSALYRSALSGRRILVILDNARDVEQVRPLLPGTPECMVVVTSRSRLTSLVTAHGAHSLTLDVPTLQEATAYFVARVEKYRTDTETAAIERIAEHCGRLPLALALVATRAAIHPDQPLTEIEAEITGAGRRLEAFSDHDSGNGVRRVFSWSYRTLGPQAARAFRLLPLYPGTDITTRAVASLTGLPPRQAAVAVRELAHARLLTARRPDRYWSHDLMLAYAAELGDDSKTERAEAKSRLVDHYRQTAHAANLALRPPTNPVLPPAPLKGVAPELISDSTAAMAWFTEESCALRALIDDAAARGDARLAWELALSMQLFHQRNNWWHDWAATMRTALEAARRVDDVEGMARTHHGLAGAQYFLGDTHDALTHLEFARDFFERLGLVEDLAHVVKDMGTVWISKGDFAAACQHHEQAMGLLRRTGPSELKADTVLATGYSQLRLGNAAKAIELAGSAATVFRELGNIRGEAGCFSLLGDVHRASGNLLRAAQFYRQGIELLRQIGGRADIVHGLLVLGEVLVDAGDQAGARSAWMEVLAHAAEPALLPAVQQARARLQETQP